MEAYNSIAIVHCLILLHFVQCIFPRLVTSFKLSAMPGFLRAVTEICSVVTTMFEKQLENQETGNDGNGNGKQEFTQIAACRTGRSKMIACKDLARKKSPGMIHDDFVHEHRSMMMDFEFHQPLSPVNTTVSTLLDQYWYHKWVYIPTLTKR